MSTPKNVVDRIEPGMKFNMLTVLSKVDEVGKQGAVLWNVRCDCGQELRASENALKKHEIRNCGLHDNREDLTGQKFGMLIAVSRAINNPYGKPQWNCKCDCGNEKIALVSYLKKFHNPNCGCQLHDEISSSHTIHGMDSHRLTPIWRAMMSRCYKPQNKDYKHYGGRGITVCDRWHDVRNFIADMEPTYKPGLQLDRLDNGKGYSSENCRWVTSKQNNRNKRTNRRLKTLIGNKTLAELNELTGTPYETISRRADAGLPDPLAIAPKSFDKKKFHLKEWRKVKDGEPLLIDKEFADDMAELVETAKIQADAIHEWGFGPAEIELIKKEDTDEQTTH